MERLRRLVLTGSQYTRDEEQRRQLVLLNVMCVCLAAFVALYIPIYWALDSTVLALLCAAVSAHYAVILGLNARGLFTPARLVYFIGATTIIGAFAALSGPRAGVQNFVFLLASVPFLYCTTRERALLIFGIVCPVTGWAVNELTDYSLIGPPLIAPETSEILSWVMVPTIIALTIILIASFRFAAEKVHRQYCERAIDLAAANQQLRAEAALRDQMAHELRLAQKLEAIGQLASGIAHEINTPIQYIGDNTTFLRTAFADYQELVKSLNELLRAAQNDGVAGELLRSVADKAEEVDIEFHAEEVPRAIEQTIEGVQRVSGIVRAMKDFSHPGSEEPSPVDLNKALETTLLVARNEWKHVAEVETALDAELPPVMGLAGELKQVFLNLLVNAAQAIGEVVADGPNPKGKIAISTAKEGNWVAVKISDTGGGIPKDIQERVFEPFFTTKAVGKGTGQGLAMAHRIVVDTHQGRLDLASEPEKGTTFIVRLPVYTNPTTSVHA